MIGQLEILIQQNSELLIGGAIAVGVLWYVYKESDDKFWEDYQSTRLSERVLPSLKHRVYKTGQDGGKPLQIGNHNKVGYVQNYLITEEADDDVIDFEPPEGDDDEPEEVVIFLCAPQGWLTEKKWFINDIFFGNSDHVDVYVVYRDAWDEDYKRAFKLNDDVDFVDYAEVLVQRGTATMNVVQETAYRKTLESVTNLFPTVAEKVAEGRLTHAEAINKLKQEGENDSYHNPEEMLD